MPPVTRNMTGSISSSTNKGTELSPNEIRSHNLSDSIKSSPNRLSGQRILNNSYIAMVSDSVELRNTELDVVSDLRNRLARAEYELTELGEEKMKLVDQLRVLSEKLEGKQIIINNLHATIETLTKKINNTKIVVHTEVQTDIIDKCEKFTQLDLPVQEKKMESKVVAAEQIGIDQRVHLSVDTVGDRIPTQGSPRILLLGDSQFRGIADVTTDVFGPAYSIQSVFKPNALFENVVEDIVKLTKSFTMSDYVLLCAGTNNALRSLAIEKNQICKLFNSLSHTNFVVFSVPYCFNKMTYNELVYKFNCDLYGIVSLSNNFIFIDVNQLHINNFGIHLSKTNKSKIIRHVLEKYIANTDYIYEPPYTDKSCYVNFENIIQIKTDSQSHNVLNFLSQGMYEGIP